MERCGLVWLFKDFWWKLGKGSVQLKTFSCFVWNVFSATKDWIICCSKSGSLLFCKQYDPYKIDSGHLPQGEICYLYGCIRVNEHAVGHDYHGHFVTMFAIWKIDRLLWINFIRIEVQPCFPQKMIKQIFVSKRCALFFWTSSFERISSPSMSELKDDAQWSIMLVCLD